MKILITGTGGFIGRNLKERLDSKYELFCPRRYEVDFCNTEKVRDYLRKHNIDIVIHAANVNNTRKIDTTEYESLDGNLRMFLNLERCKEYYGKMYYFGSGAEYDSAHYMPAMKEEYFDTYVPKDPYGFSKYVMAKICEQSERIYDLRLYGVYGKYEEWERRFISNAICRALKGKDITIQKNVYFDYLWIDDLTEIMEWFIKHTPVHKHYNVCRGSTIDLYSLACLVKKNLKCNCDIVVGEEGLKPEYSGNNDRLLSEMGEYSFTSFEESVNVLCDYYKAVIDRIDEDQL